MPLRVSLLLLVLGLAACDTGGPAPVDARPDVPLVLGRFDGETGSVARDYELRLYLQEEETGRAEARIEGIGGAVRLGTATLTVATTVGRRDGDEVAFTTTLRSGGTVGFSGELRDDGRTLVGMVSGELHDEPLEPSGIVLRWQDLNY